MSREVVLRWRPSGLAVALATAAGAALTAALLAGRAELVAFAAPLLGALAWPVSRLARVPDVRLETAPDIARCFEGETVRLSAEAHSDTRHLQLLVRPRSGRNLTPEEAVTGRARAEWSLRTREWGNHRARVLITARTADGLMVATTETDAAQVRVYPSAEKLAHAPHSTRLPERVGPHLARRRGEGVEFAGIRPYVPGDRVRDINWPVSARRDRLYVTARIAERCADVVALIDTISGPGQSRASLDTAVHGAAQLAQAVLGAGDRAGVVALGGRVRWLGPDIGQRQFYRVVDAVLDADPTIQPGHPAARASGQSWVPQGVLPSGALIVAFTPLLDARITIVLNNLRLRGYPVVALDLRRELPLSAAFRDDPLVARLWHLERRAMHRDLRSLGITVLEWRDGRTLDEALAPLAHRPLEARRTRR